MWTDLNQRNPGTLWHVLSRLNDFSQITVEGERLNPDLFWGLNKMAKVFLQNALDTFSEHKRVVVTHHLPSRRSVPLRYQERPENWGYVCEMDEMILDNGPDIWIHGHTHDSMDYPIGNTRIICNPRGYVDEGGNPKFNMNLEVEI
jgi:Icc-related predicted phosphoesterase